MGSGEDFLLAIEEQDKFHIMKPVIGQTRNSAIKVKAQSFTTCIKNIAGEFEKKFRG